MLQDLEWHALHQILGVPVVNGRYDYAAAGDLPPELSSVWACIGDEAWFEPIGCCLRTIDPAKEAEYSDWVLACLSTYLTDPGLSLSEAFAAFRCTLSVSARAAITFQLPEDLWSSADKWSDDQLIDTAWQASVTGLRTCLVEDLAGRHLALVRQAVLEERDLCLLELSRAQMDSWTDHLSTAELQTQDRGRVWEDIAAAVTFATAEVERVGESRRSAVSLAAAVCRKLADRDKAEQGISKNLDDQEATKKQLGEEGWDAARAKSDESYGKLYSAALTAKNAEWKFREVTLILRLAEDCVHRAKSAVDAFEALRADAGSVCASIQAALLDLWQQYSDVTDTSQRFLTDACAQLGDLEAEARSIEEDAHQHVKDLDAQLLKPQRAYRDGKAAAAKQERGRAAWAGARIPGEKSYRRSTRATGDFTPKGALDPRKSKVMIQTNLVGSYVRGTAIPFEEAVRKLEAAGLQNAASVFDELARRFQEEAKTSGDPTVRLLGSEQAMIAASLTKTGRDANRTDVEEAFKWNVTATVGSRFVTNRNAELITLKDRGVLRKMGDEMAFWQYETFVAFDDGLTDQVEMEAIRAAVKIAGDKKSGKGKIVRIAGGLLRISPSDYPRSAVVKALRTAGTHKKII